MPSFANLILGGIAISAIATQLLGVVTRTDGAPGAAFETAHTHKGDRLPLFQAGGPWVTVATPVARLVGEPDDLAGANTVIAIKNVVVVPRGSDQVAGRKPDPQPEDFSQKPGRHPSCEVVTGSFGKPNLGRIVGRCFT